MASLKLAVEIYVLLQAVLFPACVVEGRSVRPNGGRIIGGRNALPGEFPYQVSLGMIDPETNLYLHYCGGSILDKYHVLTAAHCGNIFMMQRDWIAVAGALNVSDFTESTRVQLPLAQVYRHEDFNYFSIQNDICLIRVKGEFPLDGTTISAIPVRNVTLDPPAECTATGWGQATGLESEPSDILQELDQPLISQEDCVKTYEDFFVNVVPGMLCSGFLGGGPTTCHGDSGGPLVCEGQVTGVVSWSRDCEIGNYPTVFADVAFFKDWIQKTLAKSYEDGGLSLN